MKPKEIRAFVREHADVTLAWSNEKYTVVALRFFDFKPDVFVGGVLMGVGVAALLPGDKWNADFGLMVAKGRAAKEIAEKIMEDHAHVKAGL